MAAHDCPTNGVPRRTLEGGGELGNLSLQLNLTPEQREQLRPILDEEGQQLHDFGSTNTSRPT
jgi:hypothetical protein